MKRVLFLILTIFLVGSCPLLTWAENIPLLSSEAQTIKVAEKTGRAVVTIKTEVRERVGVYFPFDGFGDEFFRRFFEEFFGEIPEREFKRMGLGSGVIIDREGYILTNEHVVDSADTIRVRLSDGREFKAKIMGRDERSDLAVIKIEAHNLPVAKLGDSDQLKIGQWVLAIGNPFGFVIEGSQPTVTLGVISALHRDIPSLGYRNRSYSDLIQTDAAINPGNSGGPLVDMEGRVIGINVAIISTSGGYQGLGFAIPINKAKRILNKLIKGERITYGWLGVAIQNLNQDLRNYFGLREAKGVIIIRIFPDSPAEKAGLREGDLILAVDGEKVRTSSDLVRLVSEKAPGSKVDLRILRKNKYLNVKVILGERPQEESLVQEKVFRFRGMEVEDITPSLRREYNLYSEEGVVVTYVEPDSPADRAGILPSDVIISIEGERIRNKKDFLQIVQNIEGDCLVKTNRGFFVIREESGR
ncbi:MAG: Do family serine endopeptidase [Candidatus Omnitrophica bacterium]|nr:Do family serine endopeptidase [Candidatus Omnitrophota bacterium]